MPQNITKFKIFVASPGDVESEREAVKKITNEINIYYSHFNYLLEFSGWEKCSGIGKSQDDINLLVDECDIFILIMGKTYGRQSVRYKSISNTEEEFQRAVKRYRRTKKKNHVGSPEILMYFKILNQEDISTADGLSKINRLKNKIKKNNLGIYNEFDDKLDFTAKCKNRLIQIMSDEVKKSFIYNSPTGAPMPHGYK